VEGYEVQRWEVSPRSSRQSTQGTKAGQVGCNGHSSGGRVRLVDVADARLSLVKVWDRSRRCVRSTAKNGAGDASSHGHAREGEAPSTKVMHDSP
jgi:hypothetical protein